MGSEFDLTTFEWTIGLLLGAVVLSGLARQVKVLLLSFLAIGGALLALVSASPSWTLEPKLALALFVAPVLLDGLRHLAARLAKHLAAGLDIGRRCGRLHHRHRRGGWRMGWFPTCHRRLKSRSAPSWRLPMRALLKLRQSEAIGDDACHELEEELDRAELSAQT